MVRRATNYPAGSRGHLAQEGKATRSLTIKRSILVKLPHLRRLTSLDGRDLSGVPTAGEIR